MAFQTAGGTLFPYALEALLEGTFVFGSVTKKAMLLATAPTGVEDFVDDLDELSTTNYTGGYGGSGRKTMSASFTFTTDVSDPTLGAFVDLTYLADTVILLRYFESQGEVRRAMSVVKKRTSAHENTIREYALTSRGLKVGPPLTNLHGILRGIPTIVNGAQVRPGRPP